MSTNWTRAGAIVATALLAVAVFTAAAPARTQAKPKLVREPVVTGTAAVGRILQATTGSWDNSPTSFAYHWERCDNGQPSSCSNIRGATDPSYRLTSADLDKQIRVRVTARNADGSTSAESNPVGPVSSGDAPQNSAAPTVAGSALVGSTLTADEGRWTNGPTSFAYQWLRCDSAGANCGALAGATAKTYRVGADDVGSTLRVRVTAKNAVGSGSATSGATAGVSTGTGGSAIPVSTISLPDRLTVSGIKFEPSVLRSRGTFTARFTVTDSRGRRVSGALVYVIGLPYGWVSQGREAPTDANGTATIVMSATAKVPRRGAIVFFVRARKPGEPLLGGISTRRLVQLTVRM